MINTIGIIGGVVAALCYVVMAVAFISSGQWQIGGAYVAYAISNVFLTLLLL